MPTKALYIFTPGFAADESDTTCIPFLQQVCLSLRQVSPGLQIVVFAFQYPASKQVYDWQGITVIPFGGNDRKGARRILLWLNVIAKFLKLGKQYPPMGIFSIWLTECALMGKIIAALFSLRHFTWIVGQDARLSNRYVKIIKPAEEQLVAFSEFIQKQMEDNFGLKPACVIRNGINPAMFEPLKTGDRKISIIGVGSLIPLKNFTFFIEIASEVYKRGLLEKAVIVGDGPEKESLKKLIKASGLTGIVQLFGLAEHSKTLNLMNDSRILLHTSSYDSNATVLHEALYSGCKVVSTCPIDPGQQDGFYLITDKSEMVNKICNILEMQNCGYTRLTANTMNNSAQQILNLFLNV